MIGKEFKLLKPGCRLLNVARGGVIDEAALADALKAGTVAGRPSTSSVPSRRPPTCPCSKPQTWC